jgi:hypothetical protein
MEDILIQGIGAIIKDEAKRVPRMVLLYRNGWGIGNVNWRRKRLKEKRAALARKRA